MKFLADMGISPVIVNFLRNLGYEAIHLDQEGLGRLSDSQILNKAKTEGYIVLTHDLGFADLMAAGGGVSPSIIIFRLRNMRPESVSRYLQKVLDRFGDELNNGVIVTVSEGNIRIRDLPIVNK